MYECENIRDLRLPDKMKYFRPININEYRELVAANSDESLAILAGGTDIMPRWEQNQGLRPDILIDVKNIEELSGIREKDDRIIIGALTTVQEIKNTAIIQKKYSALWEATNHFAGVQIRHRATIGGNICNASPAGDLLPGLYAHEAQIYLAGSKGTRHLSIGEFITGPGETSLEPGELVTEIHLSKHPGKSLFYKMGLRQSMAIAVVNFAVVYNTDTRGAFTSLRVAAGAVAPTVVYLNQFAHAILKGASVAEAVHLVDEDISPIDDIRASAEYRRAVLKNVLKYLINHKNRKKHKFKEL